MSPRSCQRCLLLLLSLTTTVGCSAWQTTKPYVWPWGNDGPQQPRKVVAMWTDSVAYQGEIKPVRGFGARLMFYGKDPSKPIKVNGSLVVYGFDETNRKASNNRPDRKWVFTAEQMDKHYSKSEIGHSYSVWVPWDQAGGQQTSVSLIVRFMPKKGDVVVSDQATQVLPGSKPGSDLAETDGPDTTANNTAVRQVVHEEVAPAQRADSSSGRGSRMKTTTINVPIRSGLRSSTPLTATRATHVGMDSSVPVSEPAGGVAVERRSTATTSPQVAQRSTHSAPARSRVLGEPIARPRGDHVLSQPHPAAQRSDLESSAPAIGQ